MRSCSSPSSSKNTMMYVVDMSVCVCVLCARSKSIFVYYFMCQFQQRQLRIHFSRASERLLYIPAIVMAVDTSHLIKIDWKNGSVQMQTPFTVHNSNVKEKEQQKKKRRLGSILCLAK